MSDGSGEAHDIDEIALQHANRLVDRALRTHTSADMIGREIGTRVGLAFSILAGLLASALLQRIRVRGGKLHVLLRIKGTTGRAFASQLLIDTVPAPEADLVTARTGFEVAVGDVHCFHAQRALRLIIIIVLVRHFE